MVDSCRQLTGSQSGGDEDTAGMVTILTGYAVEELADRSTPMKVCGKAKALCQKQVVWNAIATRRLICTR